MKSALAVLMLLGLIAGSCKSRQVGELRSSTDELDNSDLTDDQKAQVQGSRIYPLAEYLRDCESALGVAPKLSCDDMVLYDYGLFQKVDNKLMCAHPTLNNPGHSCVPGTGVLRHTTTFASPRGEETVDWIMICSKVVPDEKQGRFHNIDVIGYNRETGDTCFFKNAEIGVKTVQIGSIEATSIDGSRLSPLDSNYVSETTVPEQSWAMPFGTVGNCTTCHSNGPWLRSFVHRGLKGSDGKPLIPARTAGVAVPYNIVGQERLKIASGDYLAHDAHHTLIENPNKKWDPRWLANANVVSSCGKCHAVADEHYCEINVKAAYGIEDSSTAQIREFGNRLIRKNEIMQESHLVDGKSQAVISAENWHRNLHKSGPLADQERLENVLREIIGCCDNPRQSDCSWVSPKDYYDAAMRKQ